MVAVNGPVAAAGAVPPWSWSVAVRSFSVAVAAAVTGEVVVTDGQQSRTVHSNYMRK